MDREMLKEAGPLDWYNGLSQDQRYALAGSLVGGTTLGGLNMLRDGRKNRFRNFLAGAAAGGLGGAALGLGTSRLAGPEAPPPPAEGGAPAEGAAPTAPPPKAKAAPPVPAVKPPPPPPKPPGADAPPPEVAAAGAAARGAGPVALKANLYGAGGAVTGAALRSGVPALYSGARAGLGAAAARAPAAAELARAKGELARFTPVLQKGLDAKSTTDLFAEAARRGAVPAADLARMQSGFQVNQLDALRRVAAAAPGSIPGLDVNTHSAIKTFMANRPVPSGAAGAAPDLAKYLSGARSALGSPLFTPDVMKAVDGLAGGGARADLSRALLAQRLGGAEARAAGAQASLAALPKPMAAAGAAVRAGAGSPAGMVPGFRWAGGLGAAPALGGLLGLAAGAGKGVYDQAKEGR